MGQFADLFALAAGERSFGAHIVHHFLLLLG
jgi:hypothetical protein